MKKFNINDLFFMYKKYRNKYREKTYKYIDQILLEAKIPNKQIIIRKLTYYIIEDAVEKLGLKIVNGSNLEQTRESNLSIELSSVKRKLLIDYGEFGYHLPTIDIVIYEPKRFKVIAVVLLNMSKEKIVQGGYWKLKLASQKLTNHIMVYLIAHKKFIKNGKSIAEIDLDGSYVLSEVEIKESDKIKSFDKFIDDLKKILKNQCNR